MISVAMATYNGASHLRVQLDSLAGQTRRPDELVVCDDGSTDDTIAIAERFADSAPFAVRIHRNPSNLGVLRNFEKALSLCGGDHIFLSDQDDAWLPAKIARVMQIFAERPGRHLVINDKIIADEQLAPTGATMLGNIRGFGSPDTNFVAGCCAAFTAAWRDFVLPIPAGPPAHDSWIVGLAHRIGAAFILEEPLQLYRRHVRNVSHNAYSVGRSVGMLDRIGAEIGGAGGPDAADAWAMFLSWHEAEAARIAERAPQLHAMGMEKAAASALERLEAEMAAERERARIARLPRLRRVAPVGRLLRGGGYAHFSGWKSAAKDLIR